MAVTSQASGRDADNPAILVININMEDDRVERFTLRINDNPEKIVRDFAVKNKMSAHATRQMFNYVMDNRTRLVDEYHGQSMVDNDHYQADRAHNRSNHDNDVYSGERQNAHLESRNQSDSYLLRNVEESKVKALQTTHKNTQREQTGHTIPHNIAAKNETRHKYYVDFEQNNGQPSNNHSNGNTLDDFANGIAKQIEAASALIYRKGSNASSAKPASEQKKKQVNASKKPMKEESQAKANDEDSRQQLASNSEHNLSRHRYGDPVAHEDPEVRGSFQSFKGNRPLSARTANRSQISADTDRLFNRLYTDGVAKHSLKQQQIFEKQMREENMLKNAKIDRGKKYSDQIVDRLYYKGIVREDVKKFNNEKTKALRDLEQSSEYTFQPRISHLSSAIANSKVERRGRPLEDYLMDEGLSKKQKSEQAHAFKKSEELTVLQEKPRISEVSKILAHNRSRFEGRDGASKHDELYEDSVARKQKSMILQEIYQSEDNNSFMPEINNESRRIVYIKHGDQSFVERLSKYASEKEAKIMIEKAHAYPPLAQMINPDTNMPYFQPMTGRAPSTYRGSIDIGVGNYLHSLSAQQLAKLEARREMEFDRKRLERSAIPQSSSIVEEKKQVVFKTVFESLDSDKDGVISAERVDIESLDSEILKIISPMLINMEELSMEIDEQTFTYGMQEIYKKLCIADRDKLLAEYRSKRRYVDHDCTFKPQLNNNSLKIAANKKSIIETAAIAVAKKRVAMNTKYEFDSEGNALTVVNEETSETRSNLNKTEEELRDCTFQPQLNDYIPNSSHYV